MESRTAGWYPDPEMADTRRYWDGAAWTENIAPGSAPGAGDAAGGDQSGLIAAGWITMFMFPLAGMVIGLVLANRRPGLGLSIAGLSLVSGLVWLSLLSN